MNPTARTPVLALFWLLLSSWQCDKAQCVGNTGCLFSPRVCTADEDCFDDNAFGRCQNSYEPDLYQHLLGSETLRLLEAEMARLFNGGYRWDHEYTQCVVQSILLAQRRHLSYDPGMCSRLMQMTLPTVPPEVVEELEDISPEEMAFIKFTPNKNHQPSMYADETFSPPMAEQHDEKRLPAEKRTTSPSEGFHRKKYPQKISPDDVATDRDRNDDNALFGYLLEVVRDTQRLLDDYQTGEADKLPSNKIPIIKTDLSSDLSHRPAFTEGGIEWLPVGHEADDDYPGDDAVEESAKLRSRWKKEDAEEILKSEEADHNEERENDGDDDGERLLLKEILQRKGDINDDFLWNPRITNFNEADEDDMGPTFGFSSDRKSAANLLNNIDEDDDFFAEKMYAVAPSGRGMPTFQRPMRYDTKKPGPTYFYHDDDDIKNDVDFREGKDEEMAQQDNTILQRLMEVSRGNQLHAVLQAPVDSANSASPPASEDDVLEDELELKGLLPPDQHSNSSPSSSVSMATTKGASRSEGSSQKLNSISYAVRDPDFREDKRTLDRSQPEVIEPAKSPRGKVEDQTNDVARTGEGSIGHFQAVDATHAYLMVEEKAPTHDEGEKLVMHLAQKLKLPKGSFSDIRVDGNQVTFKVDPNNKKINASDVATRAEDMAADLKASSGLTVIAAGIGDKVKFEVVSKDNDRRLFILTFVLCGGVVGILIAVAVIYVVRRHARSKEKLKNIAQPETEASQDYQDLCRQRMASKTNEKPEPVHVVQSPKRVRSLSQGEGQASSSSHSSTSSWNEEPVTSNMDISTGHMILSYMEDHLKNKNRLDREWEALCAYEAEPCSTTASTLAQNVKKNRYTGVLPYDHSRVTLNELSNVSGSDYINASTITDHDPRNPAYIATQGPLPHTAADFWQMIWEQGSVVMVMLTRLMENGVAMCHRYWPEEGSEVYHIYEVHLVSEHIWCDDYLVRSFYLKNLRTSETRTVTQFHFLSWPDNGVPNSTKALLEFRRKVNKSYRGRSCPIVVHCSDGIGRTGTYCLIDMVLNRMAKGAKEIDIAATLEHIRDQRGGMVKTKAQFEFVLMAIAEEVHAILKALSQ